MQGRDRIDENQWKNWWSKWNGKNQAACHIQCRHGNGGGWRMIWSEHLTTHLLCLPTPSYIKYIHVCIWKGVFKKSPEIADIFWNILHIKYTKLYRSVIAMFYKTGNATKYFFIYIIIILNNINSSCCCSLVSNVFSDMHLSLSSCCLYFIFFQLSQWFLYSFPGWFKISIHSFISSGLLPRHVIFFG